MTELSLCWIAWHFKYSRTFVLSCITRLIVCCAPHLGSVRQKKYYNEGISFECLDDISRSTILFYFDVCLIDSVYTSFPLCYSQLLRTKQMLDVELFSDFGLLLCGCCAGLLNWMDCVFCGEGIFLKQEHCIVL